MDENSAETAPEKGCWLASIKRNGVRRWYTPPPESYKQMLGEQVRQMHAAQRHPTR